MSDFDNFRTLTAKLGSPQNGLRYIHVAGTNGKGSTCAFMCSILREAGFQRVGMYISPHLVKENERIKVNGEDISDSDFDRLERLVLDVWRENFDGELAYFAKITAMAFLYFKERNCDFVVLEVGLGGRYDATNVIDAPECAVITRIGLDHTEMLGDTVEQIAGEKAMIIKAGAPVVFTAQDCDYLFAERAETLGVKWYRTDKRAVANEKLGLLGEYQLENAANAAKAAEVIGIAPEIIKNGLALAEWPGRYEKFLTSGGVTVILDGGHNTNGVEALALSLKAEFPGRKITFVFNARADKDHAGMLALVEPIAERIVKVADTVTQTLDEVFRTAKRGDIVCVFGTLYQVGEVRAYFKVSNKNQ